MFDPVLLTQGLIRECSITPDQGNGIAVAKVALEAIGFTCTELVFGEGSEKTHNLYARIGEGSPNFCFAGHTDVVPTGNEAAWRFPPFAAEIAEGRLYGRGAEDMKAAIAAFIAASARHIEKHGMSKGSISFLLTGDEEGTGEHGTIKMLEWLKAHYEPLDVCLVGEPTNPEAIGEMVKIGRRGSMNTEIIVHGKQGHVAYPHLADNPVNKLVAILNALKTHVLDEGTAYFPPSNLEITNIEVGNASVNVIPEKASAKFNIRFNDLHQSDKLKQWIRSICEAIHKETEIKFRVSGESFLTPPGNLSSLAVDAIQEVTGVKPVLSTTGGTSDARFIKDYCPVIEFGGTGRTPHMVNEYMLVQDIYLLTDCYEAILKKYFA